MGVPVVSVLIGFNIVGNYFIRLIYTYLRFSPCFSTDIETLLKYFLTNRFFYVDKIVTTKIILGYPGTISRAQYPVPTSDFPPTAYSPSPVPTSGTPLAFQATPGPMIPHGTSPSVYATITGQHPGSTVPPAHIPVPVTNPQTGMQAAVTSLKR